MGRRRFGIFKKDSESEQDTGDTGAGTSQARPAGDQATAAEGFDPPTDLYDRQEPPPSFDSAPPAQGDVPPEERTDEWQVLDGPPPRERVDAPPPQEPPA